MSRNSLLLGLDIGEEITQVSIYSAEKKEPVFLLQDQDEETHQLLTLLQSDSPFVVTGRPASKVNFLAGYFRKILSAVRNMVPGETVKMLVVTIPVQKKELVKIMYEALEILGIHKDRAMIISHKQSYLYYVLCQKKELWMNDVGMFDYNKQGLFYYQMNIDRRKKPILVGVIEKEYSEMMEPQGDSVPDRAVIFDNVVRNALHRQIISTLYVTGQGFDGQWATPVLQQLCVGRRVFEGTNLYVSGACYAAREYSDEHILEEFVYLDEEMIRSHVLLRVYTDGKEQNVMIARAGTPWYQIEEEFDVIPAEEEEISFQVKNLLQRETRQVIFPLDGIRGRGTRLTRLGIRVCFSDVNTMILTFKDKGFGDLSPSSHRIWEQTIHLES